MKSSTIVEYQGKSIDDATIISKTKEAWVQGGNKIKDITSMKLYVKPEENKVYYVINLDFSGCFTID